VASRFCVARGTIVAEVDVVETDVETDVVAAEGADVVDVAGDPWCFDDEQPARTITSTVNPASSARHERFTAEVSLFD
jgi:hypothetical protein